VTLLSSQLLDLGWEKAWLNEPRGPDGRWVHGADGGGEEKIGFDPGHGYGGYYGDDDWSEPDEKSDIRYMPDAIKTAATAEVAKSLERQRKLIPGIVDQQVVTFTNHIPDAHGNPSVLGETMPNGTIFLPPGSTDVIGDGDARKLEKDQEKEGFWVPTATQHSLIDMTLSHEMGHVVGAHLTKRNRHLLTDPGYWAPIAKAIGIQPPPAKGKTGRIIFRDLANWADRNRYAMEKAISQYGISSPYEMQGELWAEFTLNKNPRPAAKAFGEYALSHLPPEDLPARSMKLHTLDGYK
jgi:hypothetical protein